MAGLYIHIPFCHSKCAYCDFFSTPRSENSRLYVDTLIKEFNHRSNEVSEPISTIYLGGGTPSSLPIDLLRQLIDALPLNDVKEFTIEVNPEDVTDNLVNFIKSSPVNRVSMGVQTLNDSELNFIGRRHSAEQAIKAYNCLRNGGISNISLDLIFGLPLQTLESWEDTLSRILSLSPEHLSAYTLMLEPGTRLYAMAAAGKFSPTDDSTINMMYESLTKQLKINGYEHYEISNFAKPGFKSIHNSSYWDFTPYIGLGTGAHSFDGTTRRYNPNNIKKYIESKGQINQIDSETLTEKTNDYIMVRLRTTEGLSLSKLSDLFGLEASQEVMKSAQQFIANKQIIIHNNNLSIPPELFLISDSIISALML